MPQREKVQMLVVGSRDTTIAIVQGSYLVDTTTRKYPGGTCWSLL